MQGPAPSSLCEGAGPQTSWKGDLILERYMHTMHFSDHAHAAKPKTWSFFHSLANYVYTCIMLKQ